MLNMYMTFLKLWISSSLLLHKSTLLKEDISMFLIHFLTSLSVSPSFLLSHFFRWFLSVSALPFLNSLLLTAKQSHDLGQKILKNKKKKIQ